MLYRSSRTGFNRVPFVAGCTLEIDGELLSGVTCNLSVLGLYLNIDPLPPQGAHVRLCFRLPDGGDPIEGEARVTWVNDEPVRAIGDLPPGCGLRFVSLDPSHLRRLASVIAAFQAEPEPQLGIGQPFTGRVRIPFVERCTLRGKFGEAKGSLCNLSVLGVYAALDRIPEPGTEATLAFRLPQFPGLFERPVVVVWQNLDRPDRVHALPPGCGLRFTYLSPVDQELLAARVNEYLVGLEAAVR
jgi:uncharacterized protein (TIGR02266 family)